MIVCGHEWMQALLTEEVFYMHNVNSFEIYLLLKCIENHEGRDCQWSGINASVLMEYVQHI